jgi:hypothetical protein
MTNLDKAIRNIPAGGTLKTGERTWIERSGDGKTLRMVRCEGQTETVVRTWNR